MSIQAVNTSIINITTPRDFGNVRAEHYALLHSAAVAEIPFTAILELTGKNSIQFINGLITNDVKTLQTGDGTLAAFLNVQGKIISLCRFYQVGEKLLIEFNGANRETIFKNLSRFVPAGEFFVKDVSDEKNVLTVQGPKAAEILSKLTNQTIEAEPKYRNFSATINGKEILIASHFRGSTIGFDLFVPANSKAEIHKTLIEAGAIAAGSEALEIFRLEAGIPRDGVDFSEANILLETGLDKSVSYTKGCYLGQEVIARIHWRGQPAKQLRGLLIQAENAPEKGTELWAEDGKKIGKITSSVKSLALDRFIALGYVHRYHLEVGTTFNLKSGDAEIGTATVAETPFKA